MCNIPTTVPIEYEIINFNNSFTYQATIILYPSGTSNSFNVSTSIFNAFTIPLSNSTSNILIIVNSFDPSSNCTGSDTIFVQSCCDEANATNISDFITDKIPNTIINGTTITYDPLQVPGAPVRVAIHGELTIDQDLVFANTQLIMDQGASIRVLSGKELALNNSTITAGRCNYMWKGIILENNAILKTSNGASISDAHYAINLLGNAKFAFSELSSLTTNFSRNYISFYAGHNANGHTIEMSGGNNPGININGLPNLLTPYWGQPSVPLSNSFAGIYLRDVQNFTNKQLGTITPININNINLGIASFNSSLDLPSNVSLNSISPVQISNQDVFTTTKNFNGSAVYCEGSLSNPQTITFGNLNNSGPAINIINGCKYGINAYKNVNVNCLNNNIDNVSGLGGVHVNNDNRIGNSTIIKNNRFDTRFYCAIFCSRFNSAHLEIDNNTFNTGLYYSINSLAGQDLTNVGIRLAFVSPTTLTGHISYNTFTSARIGIYASLIRGEGSDPDHMFSIDNNLVNFNKPYNDYFDANNPSLIHIHTGVWLQNSINVHINLNTIIRNAGLTGAPAGFENFLTGIHIDECNGIATLVEDNILTHMGTGILVNRNSIGSNYYCNTLVGDISAGTQTFPRGIHFRNAKLADQGDPTSPFNNTFTNFATITRKFSGVMSAPMKWFYSTNFAITPFSVTPTGNFSPQMANVPISGTCGINNPSLTDIIYERVRQIIYNELQYDTEIEENQYLDKVFAYNAIINDTILQGIDQNYVNFINEHSQDNIGQYVDALSLINESSTIEALQKLNDLISINQIEENNITVDRIALTIEAEDRELSETEIETLNAIAESNADIGGEGVLKSRTLLNREIYEEPSYMRIHSTNSSNSQSNIITLDQIHYLSLKQKENINVQVYNVVGQLEYMGTLKAWESNQKLLSNKFFIIKYYNLTEYLGCEKMVTLK